MRIVVAMAGDVIVRDAAHLDGSSNP